jgi:hypothetical protein
MRATPPDGVITRGSPRTGWSAPDAGDGGADVDGAGVDDGTDAETAAGVKYASPEV